MKNGIISVAILTVCFSTSLAAAQDKVVVVPLGKSGVKAVNDTSACSTSKAGTIRWTGTSLELCDGTEWVAFFTESIKTVTSTTGQVWMDRNLGASRVATSVSDSAAYGDLYQWGRLTDGHEQRTSPTTSSTSDQDTPGHGNFIIGPRDWRTQGNDNLWQGVNGVNNPCPAGFRLPTYMEWETERASWSSNDSDGAYASPLKLVVAGRRRGGDGTFINVGIYGFYWSASTYFAEDPSRSDRFLFSSSYAGMSFDDRSDGFSVRCIKD